MLLFISLQFPINGFMREAKSFCIHVHSDTMIWKWLIEPKVSFEQNLRLIFKKLL